MVIYGLVGGVSVGRLFLGGVVPGVLMTVALMTMVWVYASQRGYPRTPFPTFRQFLKACVDAFLPLLTPAILLGGIWTGWFTPTEAAAVAVAYALVLGTMMYRELGWHDVVQVFADSARDTAALGFIVAAASFYGWLLMRTGAPAAMAEGMLNFSRNPIVLLLIINLFLLVVGCFFETIVALLILGPILLEVMTKVGIDPVHFGVVMVLNLMIGLLTPPSASSLRHGPGGEHVLRGCGQGHLALHRSAARRARHDHDLATAGDLAAESRDGVAARFVD